MFKYKIILKYKICSFKIPTYRAYDNFLPAKIKETKFLE